MLSSVLRFSLTQRLFVSLFFVILAAAGFRAWQQIPIDAFPEISPVQVKVILKSPGMTAEEMEQQITRPLETELLGIPRQNMLRSTTKYSLTDITLDFVEGTDIYWARQQVSERLSAIRNELPNDVSGGMAPMSTPLSEMFMFTVENPNLSLTERRQLLDWEIRPILRTVPGVADVNVLGGFAKTYQLVPRAGLMAAAGISMDELKQAIIDNNLNGGVGRIVQGNDALIVRTEGRFSEIDDISELLIKSVDGQNIRVADIAEVSVGHLTRYGAVTRNGVETTQGLVIALKDANAADVVSGVKEKLAELEKSMPVGTELNVFYDRSSLIDTATTTIFTALFQAVVLVILLLAAFLGHLRAAAVISLSLPLAALMTFLMMSWFGMSANLMSLGGLVIAIGMIVDSSVVVVENVVSQLSRSSRLPTMHLIYRAAEKVALPVVSGTVIVLIVFSPLLTLTGLEGKLFTPVALTIVFAMFAALVIALTIIPVAASLLLGDEPVRTPVLVARLQSIYQRSLDGVLAAPKALLVVAAVAVALSLTLFAVIGKTFLPVLDEGDIIVQFEKSPSISLQSSVDLDIQIERALLAAVPEIRQIVARTGSDEIGLDPMGLNETDLFMELQPRSEWQVNGKQALIGKIREVLQGFPGINFTFTQPIQMRVAEMLTGGSGDISVKVFGDDIDILSEITTKLSKLTSKLDGAVDTQSAVIEGGLFVTLELYDGVARQYGLSEREFSEYLKSQLEGFIVSELIEGRRRIPIVIAGSDSSLPRVSHTAMLAQRLIVLPDDTLAPIANVARLSFREGPQLIEREKGNRFGHVSTNVSGRDIVSFVDELKAETTANLSLPTGYIIEYGGQFENQQRATRNLLMVVPAALFLILLILFVTFQSLPLAALVLANIPFAIAGGSIALFVSREYLSVPASVGFIALLGIAVLNGVVMVSHLESVRSSILDLHTRIISGAASRLRAILMTASTAMFGLIPLVFASGPGAEIQKPLAIVVIGGLITSTVATLYLLPVSYYQLEKRRVR